MPDHVYMLVSIPPKYSVAEVISFMQGKSSIWIAQNIERKAKNFTGRKFWARGYFVSTVGRDEQTIRPTSGTRNFRIAKWISLRWSHSPITKVAESFQTAISGSIAGNPDQSQQPAIHFAIRERESAALLRVRHSVGE